VLGLPKQLVAYEPDTGKEIWRCKGLGPLIYGNPLLCGDTIVCMAGYHGAAIAVKDGGQGDVTESRRLWINGTAIPQRVGSGVVVGEHIYILNDSGAAQCIECKTGKEVWNKKITGSSWSSMSYAGGMLYVTDMQGATQVFAAGTTLQLPQSNPLKELTRASPAFSDGQIFIRTYENLYCIGK
jgi:outer membrane protein assembly factor BamB